MLRAGQGLRRCTVGFSRRGYATVTDIRSLPKPGSQVHGWTFKGAKHVPELELTAAQLQHDKTGAQYIHIARDDTNNVFSIGFKTNPPDNTGVPHILEHTTLCGSEKYPVRDPFFKMQPRSLSNFMNAMTHDTYTIYPFATTNRQDFRNLMSVYMDATLHPLLKETDFMQEGWRMGKKDSAEPESTTQNVEEGGFIFKGVVYNEMKGQMSDADYLFYRQWHGRVYPDLFHSGGDPDAITELTHEQLKKFHADHYHPSNSVLFTYGDIALEDHLKEFDNLLNNSGKIKIDTKDVKVPKKSQPAVVTYGPVDPLTPIELQTKKSLTWFTGETSNILEKFSLQILASYLLSGYGSPLFRALIEAGIGQVFTPNTGFDGSGRLGLFSIGLAGIRPDAVETLNQYVKNALEKVKEDGFEQRKIDGILHQIELGLKQKKANFGMMVMDSVYSSTFSGIDLFDALSVQETLDKFRAEFAKGGYLEGLLQKYLLDTEAFEFTMLASENYEKELLEVEQQRMSKVIEEAVAKHGDIASAQSHWSAREQELLEEQKKAPTQDVSCLPTVHVSDIPRTKEKKNIRNGLVDNAATQWREAPTNGLTYFRGFNPLQGLPDELRRLIPLFCDCLLRLGTKSKSMEEIEEMIRLKTGGIDIGYHTAGSPYDPDDVKEGFMLTGTAFDRNVPDMYELLQMLIQETNFEGPDAEQKIRQLLQSNANGLISAVADSGHSYARKYANSGLTSWARLDEQTSGLTAVDQLSRLATQSDLTDVIQKLQTLQSLAASRNADFRAAVTCSTESAGPNERALNQFLSGYKTGLSQEALSNEAQIQDMYRWSQSHNPKTFFKFPYQVSYTGVALPTVPYADPSMPTLMVLANLLTNKHLHHEIREKGGAYGGGSFQRRLGGVFGFYSYRDPNPINTLKTIQQAGTWARDKEWTERDLEEGKLTVFQGLDAPEDVRSEGMDLFLYGVDHEMEQRTRERLLDVKPADIKTAAQKYLVEGMSNSKTAVLGEQKEWVKEEEWQVKTMGPPPQEAQEQSSGSGSLLGWGIAAVASMLL